MPAIQSEALQNYIANLPVGAPLLSITEETAAINTINIDDLPNGIVTGSNLIQFPARQVTESRTRATEVVRCELLDASAPCRCPDHVPEHLRRTSAKSGRSERRGIS